MIKRYPIQLVEFLYDFNPDIPDLSVAYVVKSVCYPMWQHTPVRKQRKTISVWKARLRKRGVYIPDRRRKEKSK